MPTTKYILTSAGNFLSYDELYHYGVPGMKWGVRNRIVDAYNRGMNSRVGQKTQSSYYNWKRKRSNFAKSTISRNSGNAKEAMKSTASKGFGTAAAIRVGGFAVATALAAKGLGDGWHTNISYAYAARAVNRGSQVASALLAANSAIKVSDIYKQSKTP